MLRQSVFIAGMLAASTALALPYGVYDVESVARGGTGVATSTRTTVFGNPAMMITVRPTKEMTIVFPSASVFQEDPEDMLDGLDEFQSAVEAGDHTRARSLLTTLDKKWALQQRHVAGAFVLGEVEGSSALHIKNYSLVGGRVAMNSNDLSGPPNYASILEVRGVNIIEAGVSFSERFRLRQLKWLGEVALGLTPKAMIGKVYERHEALTSAELKYNYSQGQSSGAITMDLGLAQEMGNIWAWGLVIQNLIPHHFDGNTTEVKVGPQVRAGATYYFPQGSISGDVDLTNNHGLDFIERSQVVAVGGDYELWRWLKLRAGYSVNVNDSDSATATFGLGMRWDVLRVDLAVMGGGSTQGAALQLAFEL